MANEYILQVPLDAELKNAAEAVYRRMGVSLAEAVQIFAQRSVEINASPIAMKARRARGIARKYANPDLIPMEEGAFERAFDKNLNRHLQ
ncbi:MAG: hypothetical protein J6I74_06015 [Schwartzia sp.]|nr:hypothetical protein [Schwartzia sp. (in: firmicutes)]